MHGSRNLGFGKLLSASCRILRQSDRVCRTDCAQYGRERQGPATACRQSGGLWMKISLHTPLTDEAWGIHKDEKSSVFICKPDAAGRRGGSADLVHCSRRNCGYPQFLPPSVNQVQSDILNFIVPSIQPWAIEYMLAYPPTLARAHRRDTHQRSSPPLGTDCHAHLGPSRSRDNTSARTGARLPP